MKRDNLHGWFDEVQAALAEIDGMLPVFRMGIYLIIFLLILIGIRIFA